MRRAGERHEHLLSWKAGTTVKTISLRVHSAAGTSQDLTQNFSLRSLVFSNCCATSSSAGNDLEASAQPSKMT
jgi:hypothetical protein